MNQARKEIEYIFVTHMDEVLKHALEREPGKTAATPPAGGEGPKTEVPTGTDVPAPEIRVLA